MDKKNFFLIILIILVIGMLTAVYLKLPPRETSISSRPAEEIAIMVEDQDVKDSITIKKIIFPKDGFAIVSRVGNVPDSGIVIGSSAFYPAGTYEAVGIRLIDDKGNPHQEIKPGDQLLIELFQDDGDKIMTGKDIKFPQKNSVGADIKTILTVK